MLNWLLKRRKKVKKRPKMVVTAYNQHGRKIILEFKHDDLAGLLEALVQNELLRLLKERFPEFEANCLPSQA